MADLTEEAKDKANMKELVLGILRDTIPTDRPQQKLDELCELHGVNEDAITRLLSYSLNTIPNQVSLNGEDRRKLDAIIHPTFLDLPRDLFAWLNFSAMNTLLDYGGKNSFDDNPSGGYFMDIGSIGINDTPYLFNLIAPRYRRKIVHNIIHKHGSLAALFRAPNLLTVFRKGIIENQLRATAAGDVSLGVSEGHQDDLHDVVALLNWVPEAQPFKILLLQKIKDMKRESVFRAQIRSISDFSNTDIDACISFARGANLGIPPGMPKISPRDIFDMIYYPGNYKQPLDPVLLTFVYDFSEHSLRPNPYGEQRALPEAYFKTLKARLDKDHSNVRQHPNGKILAALLAAGQKKKLYLVTTPQFALHLGVNEKDLRDFLTARHDTGKAADIWEKTGDVYTPKRGSIFEAICNFSGANPSDLIPLPQASQTPAVPAPPSRVAISIQQPAGIAVHTADRNARTGQAAQKLTPQPKTGYEAAFDTEEKKQAIIAQAVKFLAATDPARVRTLLNGALETPSNAVVSVKVGQKEVRLPRPAHMLLMQAAMPETRGLRYENMLRAYNVFWKLTIPIEYGTSPAAQFGRAAIEAVRNCGVLFGTHKEFMDNIAVTRKVSVPTPEAFIASLTGTPTQAKLVRNWLAAIAAPKIAAPNAALFGGKGKQLLKQLMS